MNYELYKGYVRGKGRNDWANHYCVFAGKNMTMMNLPMTVAYGVEELKQVIDKEIDDGTRQHGIATQADIDALNASTDTGVGESQYPEWIMQMVRLRKGLDQSDRSRDAEIARMSKSEVFEACLEWEGIIGYGGRLRNWIDAIYGTSISSQ